MPEVLDIVTNFLINSDFDGLYIPGECACMKDDLCPCGDMHADCIAGYRQDCLKCNGWDWEIGPDKPKSKEGYE